MPVEFTAKAEPIPGYKLIEPLGKGGFGEVWKAEAPGGLLKAIKLVHGSMRSGHGEEVLVEQELKALTCVRGVRHPYILSMDRFDIIDGQLIIVMELADKNLWDRFMEYVGQSKSGIPRDELLRYLEETAEALDLMNIQYRLQHSDIKPQNLFLVHNHIKVADFGLVKDLKGVRANSGGFSPLYAAPETFEGWVSEHSDQYSLAIVYQELLTGQRPFDGKNPRMLMLQHMQQQPNLEALPEADRVAIGRSLSKKPEERFPTCSEMVLALKRSGRPATTPLAPTPNVMEGAAASPAAQLTFMTKCASCGFGGRVPNKFQGRPVKCRNCGTVFTATAVPEPKPTPPPPSAGNTPRPGPQTPASPPKTPTAVRPPSPAPPTPPTLPPQRLRDTQFLAGPPVPVPTEGAPPVLKPTPTPGASPARPPSPPPARPAAPPAPPEPAVECPVCGNTQHTPVPNQPGSVRCNQCGCVHGTKHAAAEEPAEVPTSPVPPPSKPLAPKPPIVECPVCGTKGYLPLPYLGGSVRCHQCGCRYRT